jgi:hypothetical protein
MTNRESKTNLPQGIKLKAKAMESKIMCFPFTGEMFTGEAFTGQTS